MKEGPFSFSWTDPEKLAGNVVLEDAAVPLPLETELELEPELDPELPPPPQATNAKQQLIKKAFLIIIVPQSLIDYLHIY